MQNMQIRGNGQVRASRETPRFGRGFISDASILELGKHTRPKAMTQVSGTPSDANV
jgi:hypothetical protein